MNGRINPWQTPDHLYPANPEVAGTVENIIALPCVNQEQAQTKLEIILAKRRRILVNDRHIWCDPAVHNAPAENRKMLARRNRQLRMLRQERRRIEVYLNEIKQLRVRQLTFPWLTIDYQ